MGKMLTYPGALNVSNVNLVDPETQCVVVFVCLFVLCARYACVYSGDGARTGDRRTPNRHGRSAAKTLD